jgi:hypothetical protein
MPPQRREKLLSKQHQQRAADGGQAEIMSHEQPIELQRLAVPHEFPPAEYHHEVDDNHGHGLRERRHGRLARHELEFRGRVPRDGGEELVEVVPWREDVGTAGHGVFAQREVGRRHCELGIHLEVTAPPMQTRGAGTSAMKR